MEIIMTEMLWAVVLLVVGFVLLIKGADFFVEGSSSVAKMLKVPSIIIGLTIVAKMCIRDRYPAVYRRGKELYETGGVLDFAYDIYLEHDLPVAEVRAEVRGREQGSYRVTVVVDEEYGSVSSSNCTCEAFYNYEGMCKHCVAALLAYVNRRQAKDILAAKRTGHEVGEQGSAAEEKPAAPMQTAGAFKTLLNQYSLLSLIHI